MATTDCIAIIPEVCMEGRCAPLQNAMHGWQDTAEQKLPSILLTYLFNDFHPQAIKPLD